MPEPAPASDVVTVVIVHWNQPERCAETLARLAHQGVPIEAVVVDNGSEPQRRARLHDVAAAAPIPRWCSSRAPTPGSARPPTPGGGGGWPTVAGVVGGRSP
ncbi:MAG: glycosyltransferase family A protein [Acidimicrobiales bacterium]